MIYYYFSESIQKSHGYPEYGYTNDRREYRREWYMADVIFEYKGTDIVYRKRRYHDGGEGPDISNQVIIKLKAVPL